MLPHQRSHFTLHSLTLSNMTVTPSLFLPQHPHSFSPLHFTSLSLSSPQNTLQEILKKSIHLLSKNPQFFSQNPHKTNQMGISINNPSSSEPHYKTKKLFLFSNYTLLGAASSCIFLTLSLRLIPSLCGFFFILLHVLTIFGALAGCHAASHGGARWFGAHMVATVLTAIFQGSISVLVFTSSDDFLHRLKSYVREDNGVMILKLIGGLCAVIFCLEWVVLTISFFLKYYAVVEGTGEITLGSAKRSAKVGSNDDEGLAYLPYPSASMPV